MARRSAPYFIVENVVYVVVQLFGPSVQLSFAYRSIRVLNMALNILMFVNCFMCKCIHTHTHSCILVAWKTLIVCVCIGRTASKIAAHNHKLFHEHLSIEQYTTIPINGQYLRLCWAPFHLSTLHYHFEHCPCRVLMKKFRSNFQYTSMQKKNRKNEKFCK